MQTINKTPFTCPTCGSLIRAEAYFPDLKAAACRRCHVLFDVDDYQPEQIAAQPPVEREQPGYVSLDRDDNNDLVIRLAYPSVLGLFWFLLGSAFVVMTFSIGPELTGRMDPSEPMAQIFPYLLYGAAGAVCLGALIALFSFQELVVRTDVLERRSGLMVPLRRAVYPRRRIQQVYVKVDTYADTDTVRPRYTYHLMMIDQDGTHIQLLDRTGIQAGLYIEKELESALGIQDRQVNEEYHGKYSPAY